MALDQRLDATFVPGPPPIPDELPLQATGPRVAPLKPLGRDWLVLWSAQLDPRRHAGVADVRLVSVMVRAQDAAGTAGSSGSRWLAAPLEGPSTALTERPAPRSMSAQPLLAYGLARRTAELLAVLSSCLDPAERRAEGHAVRVAYLASRLAAELDLGDDARSDLLYAGLLRDAGSTGLLPEDHVAASSEQRRAGRIGRGRKDGRPAPESSVRAPHLSRPDRAAALVRVLGMSQGVLEAVASAEERWDGRGPRREKRTAVPTGARVLAIAVIAADAAARDGASPATIERALRRERGRSLEPDLVDRAIVLGRGGLWAELGTASLLDRLLELEPLHRIRQTDDAGLDAIAGAFADLVDTRTPSMGRHGRRVADFAARTSAALGLESRVADDVRRAALLHDIGKLRVPIAFLEKPGQLTEHERRVVDEHARVGAETLARSHVLGGLAPLIRGHHERLDGNGLFPVMVDDDRELGARIIALCDRFEAMTADRPWRPRLFPGQAWQELRAAATEPLSGVVLRIMERTIGDG